MLWHVQSDKINSRLHLSQTAARLSPKSTSQSRRLTRTKMKARMRNTASNVLRPRALVFTRVLSSSKRARLNLRVSGTKDSSTQSALLRPARMMGKLRAVNVVTVTSARIALLDYTRATVRCRTARINSGRMKTPDGRMRGVIRIDEIKRVRWCSSRSARPTWI